MKPSKSSSAGIVANEELPFNSVATHATSAQNAEAQAPDRRKLLDILRSDSEVVRSRPMIKVIFVYRDDKGRKNFFLPLRYESLVEYINNRWTLKQFTIHRPPDGNRPFWSINDQRSLDDEMQRVKAAAKDRLVLQVHEKHNKNSTASKKSGNLVEITVPAVCTKCGSVGKSTTRSVSTCLQDEETDPDNYTWRNADEWPTIKILGVGRNGEVLLKDTDDGWSVAVKEVSRTDREISEYDIELLKKLRHQFIVQYYALNYLPNNRIQIIMEYMPGGTLKDFIKSTYEDSNNPNRKKDYHGLEPHVVSKFLEQILSALTYLHTPTNDIVIYHGDIKSANILKDGRGNVKLSDFGSCYMGSAPPPTYEGTFPYSAPEVLKGITKSGRLADVWSVGVVLLEMINGKLPWLTPPSEKFKPPIDNPQVYKKFVDIVGWFFEHYDNRPYAHEILERITSPVGRTIDEIDELNEEIVSTKIDV